MANKVIRGGARACRVYRFPPLVSSTRSHHGEPGEASQASLQQAVSEGFREGMEKGYQEGLHQGLEDGRRQGFEEGCEQGRHRGLEEGRHQGLQVFEQASIPLQRIEQELRSYLDGYENRRRQELLELVQKVSRQVIRCELTVNPAQLLTLAEEALASMPGETGEVQILLNPEECARIRDIAPERAQAWRLVPDERLAQGECRVVTDHAEADIGCQQRLDSCMQTLSQHMLGDES